MRPLAILMASCVLSGSSCTSHTMPSAPATDAASVATDARADADASAPGETAPAELPPGDGSAGPCYDLPNKAQPVTPTLAAAMDFGYKGGPLVDGVYHLMAARQYPKTTATTYRRSLRVRDGGGTIDWASDDSMRDPFRVTTKVRLQGTGIGFDTTCGDADFSLYEHYTAAADKLTLYSRIGSSASGTQYVWEYARQ